MRRLLAKKVDHLVLNHAEQEVRARGERSLEVISLHLMHSRPSRTLRGNPCPRRGQQESLKPGKARVSDSTTFHRSIYWEKDCIEKRNQGDDIGLQVDQFTCEAEKMHQGPRLSKGDHNRRATKGFEVAHDIPLDPAQ